MVLVLSNSMRVQKRHFRQQQPNLYGQLPQGKRVSSQGWANLQVT